MCNLENNARKRRAKGGSEFSSPQPSCCLPRRSLAGGGIREQKGLPCMLGTQMLPRCGAARVPGTFLARMAWSFMEHPVCALWEGTVLKGSQKFVSTVFQLAVFCGRAGCVLEFSVPAAGPCILHRGWRWLGGCGIHPRNQIPLSQAYVARSAFDQDQPWRPHPPTYIYNMKLPQEFFSICLLSIIRHNDILCVCVS